MKSIRFTAAMLLSSAAVAGLLGACTPYQKDIATTTPIDTMQGMRAQTEKRMMTAAADAIAAGRTEEAIVHYQKLYGKSPSDVDVAVNYAQLLRKTGKKDEALKVLSKHTRKELSRKNGPANALLLNEYAAVQIERGEFEKAEEALQRVMSDATAAEYHADAYNLSGVILDAEAKHKRAEIMFRQALERWRGDPTSVMNNLALNLASQGMFDESLLTLRKALVMAPHKTEIARNIQIVSELRDAIVPAAPGTRK